MKLNLNDSIGQFQNFITQSAIKTTNQEETTYTLKWNVRLLTLPTCAVSLIIQNAISDIASTAIYGIGGVISFDVTLLAAAGNSALSAVVNPIALLILGLSTPFLKYSQAIEFANSIMLNYHTDTETPPASFNALTGRIISLVIGISTISENLTNSITHLVNVIINELGKSTAFAINEVVKAIYGVGRDSFDMCQSMLLGNNELIQDYFNEQEQPGFA
jgi:hypothetical protein